MSFCHADAQVDQKNECVLVPIYGTMVPFHILTVKNATNNQDGDHSYIRLNFNFGANFEPGAKFPKAIFLKELSYRTSDTRHATKVGGPVLRAPRPGASAMMSSVLSSLQSLKHSAPAWSCCPMSSWPRGRAVPLW
jgi:nucleosome binding factor SPN SPT16 subunit